MQRTHYILTPFGSGGDVNPFIWLGKHLQARGHEVTVITLSLFETAVVRAGLRFRSVELPSAFENLVYHPDIWHPFKGTNLVFKAGAMALEPFFEAIKEVAGQAQVEGHKVVLAAPFHMFAARLAREVLSVPLVTVHLQPIAMMSAHDDSVLLASLPWMNKLPALLRKALYRFPTGIDFYIRPVAHRVARLHGKRAPLRLLPGWIHSPDAVLCLWPEWFAVSQRDWPSQSRAVGFPLEDLRGQFTLPPQLVEFLQAGSPPILFTAGTGNAQSQRFFEAALAACRLAGLRCVFGTLFTDQLPSDLPEWACHFDYLPFSEVLPQMGAIVHHGGIGTMSQALAAGIPQLIMPMAHDQPDNAARVKRIGVGDWLKVKDFTPDKVANSLLALMKSESVKAACGRVAAQCRTDQSAAGAILMLEEVSAAYRP